MGNLNYNVFNCQHIYVVKNREGAKEIRNVSIGFPINLHTRQLE